MNGTVTDDDFVKRLEQAVKTAKMNQEWRAEYMTIMMRELDRIEEGRILGRNEGINEGRNEGRTERSEEIAADMLRDNEPLSKIMKYTKVARERLAEIAESIGVVPITGQ